MAPQRETSQEKEPPPLPGDSFIPESELFPSGTDSLPSGRGTHRPAIIVLPEVSPDWESLFPSEEPAPGMFRVEPPSPKWSQPAQPAPPPLLTRSELVQVTASGAFAVVSLVLLMSVFMKPGRLPGAGMEVPGEPVARIAVGDPPFLPPSEEDAGVSPISAPAETPAIRTSRQPVLRIAATKPLPPATSAARPAPPAVPPLPQARQVQPVPQLSSADAAPALALTSASLSAPLQERAPAALVGGEPTTPRELPLAASSTPATAAIPAAISDTAAIESVLTRYRQAFGALDVNAVEDVWPGVNTKALGNAFKQLRTQEIDFDKCQIDISGTLANAVCGGTARFVPAVGSQNLRVEPRRWRFYLVRTDRIWTMVRVESR